MPRQGEYKILYPLEMRARAALSTRRMPRDHHHHHGAHAHARHHAHRAVAGQPTFSLLRLSALERLRVRPFCWLACGCSSSSVLA